MNFAAYLKTKSDIPDFSEEQNEAVQLFDDFLESKKESIFIFKGYAGTGKTTVIKYLIEFLVEDERKPERIMAPTGRAAFVLQNKLNPNLKIEATTIHRGIYNFDDLKEFHHSKNSKEDESLTYKFRYDLNITPDKPNRIFIIDEASMISNQKSENQFFLFGSGNLLEDILKFVNPWDLSLNNKIIMVGDPAQLLPVGDNSSTALDDKYYEDRSLKVTGITLKTIFRQSGESKIIENAKALRESIERQNYIEYKIDTGKDINEVSFNDAISIVQSKLQNEVDSIVITYSNSLALDYNQLIRKALKIDDKILTEGEKLIVNQNYYSKKGDLLNGQQIIVNSLLGNIITKRVVVRHANEIHSVILKYQKALVQDVDTKKVIECLILLNVLESGERSLTAMERRAQYIEWKKRNPNVPESSMQFAKLLIEDVFFNALHVKYGYAITCHKSQGGEWPHVLVDFSGRDRANEETLRWSYTAITRTKQFLSIVHNPNKSIADLFIKKISKAEPLIPIEKVAEDNNIQIDHVIFNQLPESQKLKWNSILSKFINFEFDSFRKLTEYHQRLVIIKDETKYTINQYFKKNNIAGDTTISPNYAINYREINLDEITLEPKNLHNNLMDVFSWLKANHVKIIGIQPQIANYHVNCILSTSIEGSYLKIHFNNNYSISSIQAFSELAENDSVLSTFLNSIE